MPSAAQGKPLEEAQLKLWLCQLLLALHYMQEHKHLVHRDLKARWAYGSTALGHV